MLEHIAEALADEKIPSGSIDAAWEFIAKGVNLFDDALRWRTIPAEGVALDPSAFLDLPFVETKNLKYDSAAFKEAHATPAGA